MYLSCEKCGYTIKEISIVKKYILRDDYKFKEGKYIRQDIEREYLDNDVIRIIYICGCGEQVLEDGIINDFIRDSCEINIKDLIHKKYKHLIVKE